jgi:glycosyltransferase involved in cell wall biosynthesis
MADAQGLPVYRGALGRPVSLVVGRLVAEKGYPKLVEAIRAIVAEFWIVGMRLASDHADFVDAALAATERDPMLRSRIRLLGYRADVPDLLRAADIFMLPSQREGMPRSIIEAILRGLPTIATSIRGSRVQVIDGEAGLFVPLCDPIALGAALSRLASDINLGSRIRVAALKRALLLYDKKESTRSVICLRG